MDHHALLVCDVKAGGSCIVLGGMPRDPTPARHASAVVCKMDCSGDGDDDDDDDDDEWWCLLFFSSSSFFFFFFLLLLLLLLLLSVALVCSLFVCFLLFFSLAVVVLGFHTSTPGSKPLSTITGNDFMRSEIQVVQWPEKIVRDDPGTASKSFSRFLGASLSPCQACCGKMSWLIYMEDTNMKTPFQTQIEDPAEFGVRKVILETCNYTACCRKQKKHPQISAKLLVCRWPIMVGCFHTVFGRDSERSWEHTLQPRRRWYVGRMLPEQHETVIWKAVRKN